LTALENYGSRVGLAFQIMDDVLDVTSSADARDGRVRSEGRIRPTTLHPC